MVASRLGCVRGRPGSPGLRPTLNASHAILTPGPAAPGLLGWQRGRPGIVHERSTHLAWLPHCSEGTKQSTRSEGQGWTAQRHNGIHSHLSTCGQPHCGIHSRSTSLEQTACQQGCTDHARRLCCAQNKGTVPLHCGPQTRDSCHQNPAPLRHQSES
jgi:hypothetical protein